jgi:hypothetical protein
MGLDMYLHNAKGEQVAYWRKANAIRGWLVEHKIIDESDNCVQRVISKEQIKELIADCFKVLENRTLAGEVLPTTKGFFFGSQEYDESYIEDLRATTIQLTPLLEQDYKYWIYHDWW